MDSNTKTNDYQLTKEWIRENRLDMNIAIPAKIVEFYPTKQTAKVEIQIKRTLKDGTVLKATTLDEVPVQIFNAGGFQITIPIKAGDGCLLIFSQRDITNWQKGDGSEANPPATFRSNDISDAICIVGVNPEAKAIEDYNTEALEIRNNDKTARITVKTDGTIEFETTKTIFTGEVEFNNKVTAKDDIDCEKTITATTDVVGGGISLKDHTHGSGLLVDGTGAPVSGSTGKPITLP